LCGQLDRSLSSCISAMAAFRFLRLEWPRWWWLHWLPIYGAAHPIFFCFGETMHAL
jgi:hypothetical protein